MKHPGQHKQTSHNMFPHPLTQSRHQYQAGHTPSCLPLPSPCTFSSLARACHSSLDPQIRSSSTSLCSWSTSTYPFAIETDAFGLFCIQFFAQCSCSLLDSPLLLTPKPNSQMPPILDWFHHIGSSQPCSRAVTVRERIYVPCYSCSAHARNRKLWSFSFRRKSSGIFPLKNWRK